MQALNRVMVILVPLFILLRRSVGFFRRERIDPEVTYPEYADRTIFERERWMAARWGKRSRWRWMR